MGLKCGIVGLPNVGKSTLFNCLTNAKAQAANFPFCTIEPNIGVITVPDSRLYDLERLVKPERVVPTTVEIVDIAGLVKGASKGEGLGNKFLANIRETDAIIHVLRCFENPNIVHVDGSINPVRDKETVDFELQLKDLEAVDQRITKVQKQAATGDKIAAKTYEILKRVKEHLEKGLSVRALGLSEQEIELINDLHLLTIKPVLYLCNIDEKSLNGKNHFVDAVKQSVKQEGAQVLALATATEAEIAELDTFEERQIFLTDLGLDEPGVNKLIRSAYALLDLQTYFTAGVKEVRAWTFRKGYLAPQAAGVIHTDFEKGFIRAEVIRFHDFIAYGSESACRDAGKLSIEGKEYVVQDGDIMRFRFNV